MYNLAHRFLKNLNPEIAHNISIKALKLGLYPKISFANTEILETFDFQGRPFRLTDVEGRVIHEILS